MIFAEFIYSLIFWAAGSLLVMSCLFVILAQSPVHGALFLILAFFNAAVLFMLAGAEFLSLLLVVVYVGAVMVLFLFVVMMLDSSRDKKQNPLRQFFSIYGGLVGFIGALLILEMLMVSLAYLGPLSNMGTARGMMDGGMMMTDEAGTIIMTDEADAMMMGDGTMMMTEEMMGEDNMLGFLLRPMASDDNISLLGHLIYTDYFLAFQLAGLILLVAMVVAILLTHRQRGDVKKQIILHQNMRINDVLLASIKPHAGGKFFGRLSGPASSGFLAKPKTSKKLKKRK